MMQDKLIKLYCIVLYCGGSHAGDIVHVPYDHMIM